ncbi:PIR Superfamily Protein [Plasmodium ovale curtisi]|uniref:PIR Superfamily Protein n=1 Tax=Plasmodium ovale curtisi TaxID=864141 RepID=A0A1A8WPI8_PLAOA|nr:PIR Superfamily Protein [Plasmodium ovale curtisi]
MSPPYKDEYFDHLEKNHDFLKDLPLYFIYSLFEIFISEGYEEPYCKRIIENNHEHANYIRTLCYAIQTIFSQLKVMVANRNINDINKGCAYLNYMIHDKIKHISSSSINIQNLYKAIDYFNAIHSSVGNCVNTENFKISNDEFDKKKTLFFHTENMFSIEDRYENDSHINKSLYTKYFSECYNFYHEVLKNNFCKKANAYKSELIDFQKTFNKTKNFLKQQHITIPINDLLSPEEYNCSPDSLQPVPITRGQGIIDTAMSDSFSAHSPGQQAIDKDTSDINQSNISGIIGGTFLGTFVIFLMSYKYTPFGPWLRKKKDVANNLFNNNEIRNHELLINNSENENINLDEQLYHIKYYSEENS